MNGSREDVENGFKNLVLEEMQKSNGAANMIFNEQVKSLIKSGGNIAHFAFGQSPFPIPDSFVRGLQENAHEHAYPPIKGIPELRKTLSEFHEEYDQLHLDPENIIVGPGSKELIFLTLNAFNGVVFLASPTWPTYEQQCHLARKDPVVLITDKDQRWKVTPEIITKGIESLSTSNRKGLKLLILTNPGNPNGVRYTEQELKALSDCCRRNRMLVLSDEIYARITFDGTHTSILKLYPEGTILTNGFSKWASAGGWRIGYAYFPPALMSLFDAVANSASNTFSCTPAPIQYAVEMALRKDAEELKTYMRDCASVLQLVGGFCNKELAEVGVRGYSSEAGYYFMPDFEVIREGLKKRGIFTGTQMTEAMLKETNVALMSSEIFLRPSTDLSVRFCFNCFDGSKALKAFKACTNQGLVLNPSNEQGQKFLWENCQVLVQGLQRLKEWVLKHKCCRISRSNEATAIHAPKSEPTKTEASIVSNVVRGVSLRSSGRKTATGMECSSDLFNGL